MQNKYEFEHLKEWKTPTPDFDIAVENVHFVGSGALWCKVDAVQPRPLVSDVGGDLLVVVGHWHSQISLSRLWCVHWKLMFSSAVL